MREIKFRFYSKDAGQYAQVKSVDLGGDFFTVRYLGKNHHIDGMGQLEQFTGLHDKNGKGLQEVWEGDIISEEGLIKGNIHETNERGSDLLIPRMGTKAWNVAYKKAVDRGFDFAE